MPINHYERWAAKEHRDFISDGKNQTFVRWLELLWMEKQWWKIFGYNRRVYFVLISKWSPITWHIHTGYNHASVYWFDLRFPRKHCTCNDDTSGQQSEKGGISNLSISYLLILICEFIKYCWLRWVIELAKLEWGCEAHHCIIGILISCNCRWVVGRKETGDTKKAGSYNAHLDIITPISNN